ncbi:MAG: hypothetical protein HY817_01795 [Candidatus Abawacabacteria bacterium]|nr:hypothetical protein [Candidatus Abawacabacteria bacterium]
MLKNPDHSSSFSIRELLLASFMLGCSGSASSSTNDAEIISDAAEDTSPDIDRTNCRIAAVELGNPRASAHVPPNSFVYTYPGTHVPLRVYFSGNCMMKEQRLIFTSDRTPGRNQIITTDGSSGEDAWSSMANERIVEPLPRDGDQRLRWTGFINIGKTNKLISDTDSRHAIHYTVSNEVNSVSGMSWVLIPGRDHIYRPSFSPHTDFIARHEIPRIGVSIHNGLNPRIICLTFNTDDFSLDTQRAYNSLHAAQPNCLYFGTSCSSNEICANTTGSGSYGACSSTSLCRQLAPQEIHTFVIPPTLAEAIMRDRQLPHIRLSVSAVTSHGLPIAFTSDVPADFARTYSFR